LWEHQSKRYIDHIWWRHSPPWWGVNDIVGWIDVLGDVRGLEITATLFLPKKRISRQLVKKEFWFAGMKRFPLEPAMSNERLREKTIGIVEELTQHQRVGKLFVYLHEWRLLVAHTDIDGILTAAATQDRGWRIVRQARSLLAEK
jgi:hypothetical protein